MDTELVYLGHSNSIDLILMSDGVAVDLTSATKMTLTINGKTFTSSNGGGDLILWSQTGYSVGEIRIFLGDQTIAVGRYESILVVYNPSNVKGIVWGNLGVWVKAEVEIP